LHYEVIKNKKKINPLPFCYLDTIDTLIMNYYKNENTEFVFSVENQIDSITYPSPNKTLLNIPEENQFTSKPKRRDGTESFGTME